MKSAIQSSMFRFLSALVFFILAAPAGLSAADLVGSANIFMYPRPLPLSDLALKTASGQNISLSDYRGKVVLLHFWSIQCPACKIEEPLLENLKRNFGPSGLEILGVNLVDSPQAIMNHAAANRMPFSVVAGGGGGLALKVVNLNGKNTAFVVNPKQEAILEVPGFPTTYIVDCRGSAVGYSIGVARWDNMAAVGLLQGLISDRKTCL
ncbi:MAG TPA: TlpA disulfide reductase family protein, partial [Desulfomonilaceae bacterium]|nr:TlpA disulfide reductase family protein [Desulfomonilaceae bacterium]